MERDTFQHRSHSRRLVLGVFAATVGALVFTVAPALAGEAYVGGGSFGGAGHGAGQFDEPAGVAASEVGGLTGDVYVADQGDNRVEQFSSTGAFIAAWGWGVSNGEEKYEICASGCRQGIEGSGEGQLDSPGAVAVDNSRNPLDPSAGDVYIANTADGVIEKFSPDGAYISELTEAGGSPFSGLEGIAVETVYSGDLWVYQSNGEVDEFSNTGEFLKAFNTERGTKPGIAVDSNGDVYVISGAPSVLKFEGTTGRKIEEFGEPAGVVAINPSTGDLLVDSASSITLYGPFGEPYTSPLQTFGAEGEEALSESHGIAVDGATGAIYASESQADAVEIFTSVALPSVSVEPASNLEKTGGEIDTTLTGSVNPEGVQVTSCRFEYGTSTSYGKTAPCETEHGKAIGEGTKPVPVHADIKGLLPGATYDYRLIAENASAHPVHSANEAFPTPPAVEGLKSGAPLSVTQHTATLNGSLTPDGTAVTSCELEYGIEETYSQAIPCSQTEGEIGDGSSPVAVSAEVKGLLPNTTYHYRLAGGDAYGTTTGQGELLLTTAPPTIETESFAEVGLTTATVTAQIDGNGAPTVYRFEYGATTSYGSTTEPADLSATRGSATATAQLTGLAPNTTYHSRVIATNTEGTETGAEVTFTTYPTSAYTLPDGRAYEMVTSPANDNADVRILKPRFLGEEETAGGSYFDAEQPLRAAADGDSVTYATQATSGGGNSEEVEYLATRAPTGGWEQVNISPNQPGALYQAFSSDLSVGVLTAGSSDAPEAPGLSPGAPGGGYSVLYSHTSSDNSYQPLLTTTPPNRSAPEFGSAEIFAPSGSQYQKVNQLLYAGGSSNSEHLLFEANDALQTGGPPIAVDGGEEEDNLYETVDGQLHVVNVLPGAGQSTPGATFGSSPWIAGATEGIDFSNVISADGSRIFWSTLENIQENGQIYSLPKALYVRENGTTTMQVDASLPGAPASGGGGGGGHFWTASGDGSKVFFTDCHQLTKDSTAVFGSTCHYHEGSEYREPAGNDLYEYEVNPVAGQPGVLRDLTVDDNQSDPLGADVQGAIGASEDGEYVYFVADGVLTSTPNARGEHATPGDCDRGGEHPMESCNLYVSHRGVTTFIATLSVSDNNLGGQNGEFGDWKPSLGKRTAEVTPDGHSVVFMSQRSLTGYDNDGPANGTGTIATGRTVPLAEVFVYDVNTNSLICASCNPSGESPTISDAGGAAAYLPPSEQDTYLLRWVSDDGGRVFFDSVEPLVPQDINGKQDVYEWEREDVGSCRVGSSNGCVYLLSGGANTDASFFVDASERGDDVFITSRAQLVPRDLNNDRNVFDVRVGGVGPVAQACSGTGCQGVPPAPPIFATPSSVTFDGVGNFATPAPVGPVAKPKSKPLTRAQMFARALRTCRAMRDQQKRADCVARTKKRYSSKAKTRSGKSDRGGRS